MGRGAGDPLAPTAPQELRLTRANWEAMRAHIKARVSEEACGMVAGVFEDQVVDRARACASARAVIPVTNLLHSPVRFRMDPQEQLQAFEWIEKQGWSLLAIFHSHPHGPAYPSPTDLAEAYYPEALALIWAPFAGSWECQAYRLEYGQFQPARLTIEQNY